jgi:hypothetical protein
MLKRYYDERLFRGETLRTLKGTQSGPIPRLHILATSFTTGGLCSFDSDGLRLDDGKETKFLRSSLLPISLAVAASSAFPPLFPPVELSRDTLDVKSEDLPWEEESLTDGGVFDNLGIRKFFHLHQSGELDADVLLVSDAGAGFDWQVTKRFRSLISRTVRTTDILMKRVGDFERAAVNEGPMDIGIPMLDCNIRKIVDHAGSGVLEQDIQAKVSRIRTDLDRFSREEVKALLEHGYGVARDSCSQLVTEAVFLGNQEPWIPKNFAKKAIKPEAVAKCLKAARVRRIGLWNPNDWASWLIGVLFVAAPAVVVVSLIFNAAILPGIFKSIVKYNVSINVQGIRNTRTDTLTPFRASSGQVNVGCDATANGEVEWTLPAESSLEGPVSAAWVNTDNLSSSSASPIFSAPPLVKAQGLIRGLSSQALPFGLRNCPGGGHGELVISGVYRAHSVQQTPVSVPLDGTFTSQPLIFTLPTSQDVSLRHINIAIKPENSKQEATSISFAVNSNEGNAGYRSDDGEFHATLAGTILTIAKARSR